MLRYIQYISKSRFTCTQIKTTLLMKIIKILALAKTTTVG